MKYCEKITLILVSKLMFTVFTFFHLQIICQFFKLSIIFFYQKLRKYPWIFKRYKIEMLLQITFQFLQYFYLCLIIVFILWIWIAANLQESQRRERAFYININFSKFSDCDSVVSALNMNYKVIFYCWNILFTHFVLLLFWFYYSGFDRLKTLWQNLGPYYCKSCI